MYDCNAENGNKCHKIVDSILYVLIYLIWDVIKMIT